MADKSPGFKKIEEALDMVSNGLLYLEETDLAELGGPRAVDIAARINAQYNALEKHLVPLKDRIKAETLEKSPRNNTGDYLAKGMKYQALIKKVVKTVLNTPEIKK